VTVGDTLNEPKEGIQMRVEDREKIEGIIQSRKRAHVYYTEKSPVYRKFMECEAETYRDSALGKREKEMIAIGISLVTNCESCMEWHIHEALTSGATEDEIVDAIGIGIEMGGGPATVAARFAATVLEYYSTGGSHEPRCRPEEP
jgi:AhpD family alkylhydroperoxidase